MAPPSSARLNLHETLERHGYDHGVVCTYTFDHEFFEDYCLEQLRAFSANGNLTVIVDQGTYEKAIACPASHRPRKANLRYLLHPIAVPGVFHSKLYLFTSANKGKLIIGSANCTRAGLTSNAELAGVFTYEREKDERFAPLLRSAFRTVQRIAERWPSQPLMSNLADMGRAADWLFEGDKSDTVKVRLLDNLDRPLWDQIKDVAPSKVKQVRVLSRYFDKTPSILDGMAKDYKDARFTIHTQNGSTTLTPGWLKHDLFRKRRAEVILCEYQDEGRPQTLHGKALSIEGPDKGCLVFGSANFTSAALMRNATKGNVETMLVLADIPVGEIKQSLFTQHGKGTPLTSAEMLRTAPHDEHEPPSCSFPINLQEAELKGNTVWVRMMAPPDYHQATFKVRIDFHDEAVAHAPLTAESDGWFFAQLDRDLVRRLGHASSVASVVAVHGNVEVAKSNPVLVVNLLDIATGESIRKSRAIRQAEMSALQFTQALLDLLRENDPEQLLLFLNLCDIPVRGAVRLTMRKGGNLLGAYDGTMRTLGDKNLKIFTELHDAALEFISRHMRKLQRHVRDGSLDGAGNYLHIFLAMGSVLRMQIERATTGLEESNRPLVFDEWGTLRDHLSIYFERFRDLMRCLWDEYLPALCRLYPVGTVAEQFEPDLAPIRQLTEEITKARARIELKRKTSLRVFTQNSARMVPQYFSCVLSDRSWPVYLREIGKVMNGVDRVVTLGVAPWVAAEMPERPSVEWEGSYD